MKEMDSSVKENVKLKILVTEYQEIWDTMKWPNFLIIRIEEGEENQGQGPRKYFQ